LGKRWGFKKKNKTKKAQKERKHGGIGRGGGENRGVEGNHNFGRSRRVETKMYSKGGVNQSCKYVLREYVDEGGLRVEGGGGSKNKNKELVGGKKFAGRNLTNGRGNR